ncbi:MAG: hypothetical protein SGARI_006601, partial [Bacillariaceae sp.]
MSRAQSTATSRGNSIISGGKDTSILAGASTESHPSKPTEMPPPSLNKSKEDLESESSIISNTNQEPTFTSSDDAGDEEAMKRKCELDASNVRPRKRRGVPLPKPTEIHMKLRAAGDAGDTWWYALEEKYGKGEALLINGIIMKYLNQQDFPADGGVEMTKNKEFLRLAKEGWHLYKKYDTLLKEHPKESAEQFCRK